MTKLLAISGCAKVGKDLFFNLLCKAYPDKHIKRMAFADALKHEVAGILAKDFNIDVFDCTPEQKEDIRGLLVWWGTLKRKTNPDYWLDIVARQIEVELEKNEVDLIVCTDTRYVNEARRLKNLGGKIVYIDKMLGENLIQGPANDQEEKYTLPIEEEADCYLVWQDKDKRENLKQQAKAAVEWLKIF